MTALPLTCWTLWHHIVLHSVKVHSPTYIRPALQLPRQLQPGRLQTAGSSVPPFLRRSLHAAAPRPPLLVVPWNCLPAWL